MSASDTSLSPQGRLPVKVDRQREPLGKRFGEGAGAAHASLHGGVTKGHEGDDVHRAESWVAAKVGTHVDTLDGHPHGGFERQRHTTGIAGDGEHAAAMIRVCGGVKEPAAGNAP